MGWWESEEELFWPVNYFSKSETTICKYWTLIQFKIGMTCVCKEYEGKIKIVQEPWLQLKMNFILAYNMKNVI